MASEVPEPEVPEANFFDPDHAREPQPRYREMLASGCPVHRAALTGGAVISRYEDVLEALRHPEIFSSQMDIQMALGTERPMIPQQIDPPAQTKFRKILDPRFSRKRMKEFEPAVRTHAHQLVDAFVDAGKVELNRAFAIPLPCTAFLKLLGLPLEELDTFLRLKDGIIRPDTTDPEEATRIRAATGKEIYAYFERVARERSGSSGDDMISYLLEAEIDGDRLTEEEILDVCFLLILAGLDTVTATIGCNIAYLAANPDQRRKLVEDPGRIDSAIEELLRWETPVTAVPRICARDYELGGVTIKKGEMVTMLLGAANLDDAEFGDGGAVELGRERNRHLAFGGGPHRCLGSHLARMELRVALEVLHERIPEYAIEPGEVPRYSPGIREVQYLPLVFGDPLPA